MENSLTSASSSCVAIGTLNEFDGETLVSIQAEPPGEPTVGGVRITHSISGIEAAVRVVDVEWNEIVRVPWAFGDCELIIDADDPVEPAVIRVSVLPGADPTALICDSIMSD